MKTSWLISGTSLVLIVCAGYWLFQSEEDLKPSTDENKHNQPSQNIASTLPLPDPALIKNTKSMPEDLDAQIEDSLIQFTEFSKYPPTSQPITNTEHINAFLNSSLPQSSLPFPFDDLETPIQLSIELNQHNYFYGDTVIAEVNLSATPENASTSIRGTLMSIDGDILTESTSQEYREGSEFISFDTSSFASRNWPIEMNVGAYVDVNGRNMFISAPFKINDETASLESLGFSEPVAENLIIPLNLNVELAGYYYVAAILYSTSTDLPLVHLETEGKLTQGLSSLNLKAHIQALKKGGDEGPYYLDNIRIERWSDDIIPRDIAGKVSDNHFLIDRYDFNNYQDTPYIDPLAEERQRLIQGLSSR